MINFNEICNSLGLTVGQKFKIKGKTPLHFEFDGLKDDNGNNYPRVLYGIFLGNYEILEYIPYKIN